MKTAKWRMSKFLAGIQLLAMTAVVACRAAGSEAYFGGMEIVSIQEGKEAVRVSTTGAEFRFDKAQGRIECFQRIPEHRRVGVLAGLSLQDLKSEISPDHDCHFSADGGKLKIRISRDSLMRVHYSEMDTAMTITGAYEPQHQAHVENHFFLPDNEGGMAIYSFGQVTCQAPASWKLPWSLQYRSVGPGELWVSVFPPKPFDWQASCETMLHSFSWKHPYPSDDELKAWRGYGSVLTLHSFVWRGDTDQYIEKDNSWLQRTFQPKSEPELLRVSHTAHRLGMKVLVYMSPFYAADPATPGIDAFVAKVRTAMKRYDLDGVYFDGTFVDIRAAYEVVTKMRSAMGPAGILHIHSTGIPPINCPFIDCHANYLLWGEHEGFNRDNARWNVSGYNLSNSIGTFCYDTGRVDRNMIDIVLAANARLPVWVGDGTWAGLNYYLDTPELQLIRQEYLPRIYQIRKDHALSRP